MGFVGAGGASAGARSAIHQHDIGAWRAAPGMAAGSSSLARPVRTRFDSRARAPMEHCFDDAFKARASFVSVKRRLAVVQCTARAGIERRCRKFRNSVRPRFSPQESRTL
jgi:hypothetical protein